MNPLSPELDLPRNLWIAISRPDSLVDALAIATLCRDRFAFIHLLYEESPWWGRACWEGHRAAFDAVTGFPKVRTCRGLGDLLRHYRALCERQRRLAELNISGRDVVVTLAAILNLSNALASAYPDVPRVLVVTRKKYEDTSRPADWIHYRHTTSSWFQYHLLEPLAGVRRTLQLKPRRNRGGDGVRLTRLAEPLDQVFDAVLVMSNSGSRPAGAAPDRVFSSPFPGLRDLRGLPGGGGPPGRPRVVFFGTPFKLVENLPPASYAGILNRCFDYLRQHYGDRCDLIYRPHPAETDERASLRMDGIAAEDDQEVAQLYFLKRAARIEAVYSVSSTVSRVAYNYGMNAYAFWPLFPFPEAAVAYFKTLMDEVPPEFEVRSLDSPPVTYAAAAPKTQSRFADALDAALDGARKRLRARANGVKTSVA